MSLTIEEAKAFITDADKAREGWLKVANQSWDEIKKRQKNGRLWSITPNSLRKRARYPAWYSIFKIRQNLIFSRVGIPICKDTTQDGTDNIGACAAMCKERLATNLARSFDFFEVLCNPRDDFIATNFGIVRAYYERDEVKQRVKEYIEPKKTAQGVAFYRPSGEPIKESEISQDDQGFFIEHKETIDVENERICLEPVMYRDVYIDPDIRRWARCSRIAFAEHYTEREFSRIFGAAALTTIPRDFSDEEPAPNKPRKRLITVYELWDKYERECYWFAENGEDFIRPTGYYEPEEFEEDEQPNGLYDLGRFFPCPTPLLMNQPTDEFWPVPEYFQLIEIFEDIHNVFSRMIAVTKAIRARLLFDNNIDGLQQALNEATEGDAFGVANLTQALVSAGGSLENVAQYIPTAQLIESLSQLYQALEQRLNIIYKLTGTSDLLQGLVTDPIQRTFGERQMTEKYALNQLAEPQRKMQEFVLDCYELMCEMALKNFKDASLDMYITPQTLPDEFRGMYRSAVGMLKEDNKRFRIDLETDSTIALNEEYDKQARSELVTTLTEAIEKAAMVAQQTPELAAIELHAIKFLIQGFRQSKMFQSEITQALDDVIKKAQDAAANPPPPPFDKDKAMADIEQGKLQLQAQELQLKTQQAAMNTQQAAHDHAIKIQSHVATLQSKERIEGAKINSADAQSNADRQVEVFKAQNDAAGAAQDRQIEGQKIGAQVQVALINLQHRREHLALEMQKLRQKAGSDAVSAQQLQQAQNFDMQLEASQHALEARRVDLDEREKFMTENRLQAEHELEQARVVMEAHAAAQAQQPGVTIKPPARTPIKQKKKVELDTKGRPRVITTEDQQ